MHIENATIAYIGYKTLFAMHYIVAGVRGEVLPQRDVGLYQDRGV